MSGTIKNINGIDMRHVGNINLDNEIGTVGTSGARAFFPCQGINSLVIISGDFTIAAAVPKDEMVEQMLKHGVSPESASIFCVEPTSKEVGAFVALNGRGSVSPS